MPRRSGQLMLLDDPHFPVSILHVLIEKSRYGIPGPIPAPDFRALPNLAAAADDAQVMFIVLVTDQLFVKIAEALKHALKPATIGYGIHATLVCEVMEFRAADRKGGMVGRCHCPLKE